MSKEKILILALGLGMIINQRGTTLPTIPPQFAYNNDYYGKSLCAEHLNTDNLYEVFTSNELVNSGFQFNLGNGNWSAINALGVPASQISSGCLRGNPYYRDLVLIYDHAIRVYQNDRNGRLPTNPSQTLNYHAGWISTGRTTNDIYDDLVATPGNNGTTIYHFRNVTGTLPATPSQTITALGLVEQIKADKISHVTTYPLCDAVVARSDRYLDMYFNAGPPLSNLIYNHSLDVAPNGDLQDFAIADLNRDGYNDIVALAGYDIKVYHNDQTGHFTLMQTITLLSSRQLDLGDVDYDGYPDLLIANDWYVRIFANNHAGSFTTTPIWSYDDMEQHFSWWWTEAEVAFKDLCGNGALSVLLTGPQWESGPLNYWLMRFMDSSNPPPPPPYNYHVYDSGDPDRYPILRWSPNEELDFDHCNVYRALMPDTTHPDPDDFDLLASVYLPDTSYTDSTVSIHTGYDNYYIWYAVTAVDDSSNESLMADPISFWGYHEESFELNSTLIFSPPDQFKFNVSPNPFNPSTVIRYQIPEARQVSLRVYDPAGRLVQTLVNGWREAGTHKVLFDGSSLPSGVYLYQLQAGEFIGTGKMVLLK